MSPPPHKSHQEVVGWLAEVFRTQARRYDLWRVYVQAGRREPASGERNYRILDLMVVPADRERGQDGWLEGGVALAVEVRSPREEVLEKIPFYAVRDVDELLYSNPRTFEFELFRLAGTGYVAVSPDREGACELRSVGLRIRRIESDGRATLEILDMRGGPPLPSL